jgi:hypothetical protein
MENQPDVNLVFSLGQGVTGKCFEEKRPIYATPEAIKDGFRFPPRLRPLTSDLQAIISYPIYEPFQKGRQSGRLVGVVNLDSKTKDAYVILTEDGTRSVVDQKMKELAALIGQVYH